MASTQREQFVASGNSPAEFQTEEKILPLTYVPEPKGSAARVTMDLPPERHICLAVENGSKVTLKRVSLVLGEGTLLLVSPKQPHVSPGGRFIMTLAQDSVIDDIDCVLVFEVDSDKGPFLYAHLQWKTSEKESTRDVGFLESWNGECPSSTALSLLGKVTVEKTKLKCDTRILNQKFANDEIEIRLK